MIRSMLCIVIAIFATACAPGVARYVNPDPKVEHTLKVWLENTPLLNADDAIAGCMVWREKGVVCVLDGDYDDADIEVHVDQSPCTLGPDNLFTLASAYPSGKIVFQGECFFGDDRKIDRNKFRAVMGHEVGHEIGISHVPLDCNGKDVLVHPSGQKVCGVAIMNPQYDPVVDFITVPDSLAFDMRDQLESVIIHASNGPQEPDRPICVYRTKRK